MSHYKRGVVMGYNLSGDQFKTLVKRVQEILRQFGQTEYPFDPEHAIRTLTALQKFSEGKFLEVMGLVECDELVWAQANMEKVRWLRNNVKLVELIQDGKLPLKPSQINVPHLIPDWVTEVVEDVEPTITEGAKLSFPRFLRKEDKGVTDGPTMRKRAGELVANKGLSDVPALLGEDGKGLETIPAELRGKVYIVLTGTLLKDSDGKPVCPVPPLGWWQVVSELQQARQ